MFYVSQRAGIRRVVGNLREQVMKIDLFQHVQIWVTNKVRSLDIDSSPLQVFDFTTSAAVVGALPAEWSSESELTTLRGIRGRGGRSWITSQKNSRYLDQCGRSSILLLNWTQPTWIGFLLTECSKSNKSVFSWIDVLVVGSVSIHVSSTVHQPCDIQWNGVPKDGSQEVGIPETLAPAVPGDKSWH